MSLLKKTKDAINGKKTKHKNAFLAMAMSAIFFATSMTIPVMAADNSEAADPGSTPATEEASTQSQVVQDGTYSASVTAAKKNGKTSTGTVSVTVADGVISGLSTDNNQFSSTLKKLAKLYTGTEASLSAVSAVDTDSLANAQYAAGLVTGVQGIIASAPAAVTPADPSTPSDPAEPTDPSTPDEPSTPSEPSTDPATPEDPDTPAVEAETVTASGSASVGSKTVTLNVTTADGVITEVAIDKSNTNGYGQWKKVFDADSYIGLDADGVAAIEAEDGSYEAAIRDAVVSALTPADAEEEQKEEEVSINGDYTSTVTATIQKSNNGNGNKKNKKNKKVKTTTATANVTVSITDGEISGLSVKANSQNGTFTSALNKVKKVYVGQEADSETLADLESQIAENLGGTKKVNGNTNYSMNLVQAIESAVAQAEAEA